MVEATPYQEVWMPNALLRERARLVRLCASLTGDPDAAEDLAQETLIEAWRHVARLHDPSGLDRWLSAIARHICRRWRRRRGRDVAHVIPSASDFVPDMIADGAGDLTVELEQDELADLLDKALALLPPETRAALVARYIEEIPQAEIAARLGVSEGAVAVRLHRGKLTLRRLLTAQFPEHTAAYGLIDPAGDAQETRIWCPECGRHRLVKHRGTAPHEGDYVLRCPQCHAEPNVYFSNPAGADIRAIFGDVRGEKPRLTRIQTWVQEYYRDALTHGVAPCIGCGRLMPLRFGFPPDGPPSLRDVPGLHIHCTACGRVVAQGLHGLVLSLPDGQRFWRAHQRIRLLPDAEIEAGGVPARVVTMESLASGGRYTVVAARESYCIISVNGEPVRE
jgi:RNA polymerase sigma-70 factor (ECF subfamily)